MNFFKKHINVIALITILAVIGGKYTLADWTGATPSGNITVGSFTLGGAHFQKVVPTDPSGAQVGTTTSPLVNSIAQGGNTVSVSAGGAASVNIANVNGAAPSAANPLASQNVVGGTAVSASNPNPVQLSQGGAVLSSGNPLPSQPIIGGSAVSSANPLPISLATNPATYSVGNQISVVANASDVIQIQGSASKLVKVTGIGISINQACGSTWAAILRRSSTDTGGSVLSGSASRHDTNDSNPTAVVTAYTTSNVATGFGTLVGYIRSGNIVNQGTIFDFGITNDKPLILRGNTDFIDINLLGSNSSGCTLFPWIEWTEE